MSCSYTTHENSSAAKTDSPPTDSAGLPMTQTQSNDEAHNTHAADEANNGTDEAYNNSAAEGANNNSAAEGATTDIANISVAADESNNNINRDEAISSIAANESNSSVDDEKIDGVCLNFVQLAFGENTMTDAQKLDSKIYVCDTKMIFKVHLFILLTCSLHSV